VIGVNQVDVQKTEPETPCLAMRPRTAAKALGISERLLWDWIRRGLVPHARIGGVVVCPTDSLRDWLQRQAEAERDNSEEKSGETT
jgi:predicted DNA-binding transcriptional regulator AlpA